MTTIRAEFAVVGGGITGLSAAWALTRRGRDVVLVEQGSPGHLRGGSHGSCRIFRLGYDDPEYVAMARRARALWSELEDACGERLLHPAPQLTFGPKMETVRAAMAEAGGPCETLSAAAAAERFPGIRSTGDVLLELESAVIAADRSLAALARQAGSAGPAGPAGDPPAAVTWPADLRSGVRVTGLADDGRRVRLSTTTGDIEARCAIVCAGPWTAGLLAPAGIAVPGSATLEQVAYLAPAAGAAADMPIFVSYGGEFPYGLPVPGSERYKVGLHHGGPPIDPDRQDQRSDAAISARIEAAARSILPGFDPVPAAMERCVYDNSPDEDFVVDRIGNVVIGSGTSGHGFKFGPLLGDWLADLACSAGSPPARFAVSRF
jgi:sarcosine oxidase